MTTALSLISKFEPCTDGRAWVARKTPEQAWQTCERGDWMLWFLEHAGASDDLMRRLARRFALDGVHLWDCPPVVRQYLETGDESLRRAAQARPPSP